MTGEATKPCPNGEEILVYAKKLRVKNARLEYDPAYGWTLKGTGSISGWPAVWAVAEDLGIQWGCGGEDYHQIDPTKYRKPQTRSKA